MLYGRFVINEAAVDYELGVFAKSHGVGLWLCEVRPQLGESIFIILFQNNNFSHVMKNKLNNYKTNL